MYRQHKMRQAMRKKIRLLPVLPFRPGKKGGHKSDLQENVNKVNIFLPTCPPSGSKKCIVCFLENMRYIRDGICIGHIRRRVYISVPAG